MKRINHTLAIAATFALLSVCFKFDAAVAGSRFAIDTVVESGPVLSLDELVTLIQVTNPDREIAQVTLEHEREVGLIYKVELDDEQELYIDAQTGETLELDD